MMSVAGLTIDLDAIARNWRALDALSKPTVETGAVLKADAYGLGLAQVAPQLARAGARSFFVAYAEEGAALRRALGPGPDIYVFSGLMQGDVDAVRGAELIPLLNSPAQVRRFLDELPGMPAGLQLDSGMNRLGLEPADLPGLMFDLPRVRPRLVMSHLACAATPGATQNATQLAAFTTLMAGFPGTKTSLAATGGILLGPAYHFSMTRPGIGLYGGAPFAEADPVVRLSLPVIQTRDVLPGEFVGYGATFRARKLTRIATVAGGYADGILRILGEKAQLFAGNTPCPLAGCVSMDVLTVDVSHLEQVPQTLDLIGPVQTIDALAELADTIGYEILTSLGSRYRRHYPGGENGSRG